MLRILETCPINLFEFTTFSNGRLTLIRRYRAREETAITAALAWLKIEHTGNIKTIGAVGGMIQDTFLSLKQEISSIRADLKKDSEARKKTELVLAHRLAELQNVMRKKNLIAGEDRIDTALSMMDSCQICMENHRIMRLYPCGHMATCQQCTDKVVQTSGRCPLCRRTVVRADRTYLS